LRPIDASAQVFLELRVSASILDMCGEGGANDFRDRPLFDRRYCFQSFGLVGIQPYRHGFRRLHKEYLPKQHRWPGMKAIGTVVRVRETADNTSTEAAYCLLSTALAPERFNEGVRQHWGVENSLHWRLDLVMNEDQGSTRMGHGPHNQSGGTTRYGHQRHAKEGIEWLPSRQVQTRRLGR
jgi:hypothetical protein